MLIGDRSVRYEVNPADYGHVRALDAPLSFGSQRPYYVRPAIRLDPRGPSALDYAQDRLSDALEAVAERARCAYARIRRRVRFHVWRAYHAIEQIVDAPALWSDGDQYRALMLCVAAGAIFGTAVIAGDQLVLWIIHHFSLSH